MCPNGQVFTCRMLSSTSSWGFGHCNGIFRDRNCRIMPFVKTFLSIFKLSFLQVYALNFFHEIPSMDYSLSVKSKSTKFFPGLSVTRNFNRPKLSKLVILRDLPVQSQSSRIVLGGFFPSGTESVAVSV